MLQTCNVQSVHVDFNLEEEATPALRVVGPTQARHVDHTLLVHVHVAGCNENTQVVESTLLYENIMSVVMMDKNLFYVLWKVNHAHQGRTG